MKTSRVFVNHYNCLTPSANNATELFENICIGKSGIKTNTNYLQGKSVGIGIIEFNLEEALVTHIGELLDVSNLKNFEDTLLIIGSSVGGMRLSEEIYLKDGNYKNINPILHAIDFIKYKILQKYKFKDDVAFSTACTSSANALGYAYEVISKGIYKNALVIGYDTLCKTTVGGFNALGVLSSSICQPFSKQRDGMNVAEGYAVLLLQDEQLDDAIEMCGVGYSSDAFHMTQPNPQGATKAMQNALLCRGLDTKDIGYINAHGTGTIANDISEINAIRSLFGTATPISSTKSITGHTLGAAGALEAMLSVMVLEKQTLLPNLNLDDPEIADMNYVTKAQKSEMDYVLSNSLAFGGNNTSLLFGRKR
ncbi:MAG: beta-ketoacyl-[acyl-carrier-protein] synthase family protein [Sulfurospirillaceae bacterium]|nr:beta-ketoacyl-[acyl-carrier-protein] synthase family protein [Sulfurospirillaceae bacterium]